MRTSLWLLGPLMACSQSLEKPQTDQGQIQDTADSDAEHIYAFSVTLSASSAVAGELVPFTWTVVDSDGEAVDFEDINYALTVNDTLETDLYTSSIAVQPTIVGTHGLTFTLQFDDQSLTSEAELVTSAAAIDHLNLSISDGLIEAGEATTFEITGADRFGNSIDTSTAVWAPISTDGAELYKPLRVTIQSQQAMKASRTQRWLKSCLVLLPVFH